MNPILLPAVLAFALASSPVAPRAAIAPPAIGHAPAVAAHREPSQPTRVSVPGIASWGRFGGHVVTRLRRGTRIEVCGRLGCWSGFSWGYGPALGTGRLVDLDAAVFRRICGPLSAGLCRVALSWT